MAETESGRESSCADGEARKASVVQNESGERDCVLPSEGGVLEGAGTATDISEQTRLEQALRRSEEQFRFLVESIPHFVWSARPDGYCDYFNRRALTYLGLSLQEAQGWQWATSIHPDDCTRAVAVWTEAFQQGKEYRIEIRIRRASEGDYRWYLIHALPLRDDANEIVRWYGTGTDIHERKQAEEAVLKSEARFRHAARAARSLIYEVDNRTRCVYRSEGLYDLLGYHPGDVPPTVAWWVEQIHPDDRAELVSVLDNQSKGEQQVLLEYRIRHKSGVYIYVEDFSVWVDDGDGNYSSCVGSARDISERKQAVEAIRLSEARLAEANARLEALATTDGLTGLKNHRTFYERFREEIERAYRYRTPLSLILLDVDSFKAYNDSYGHLAGDAVLRKFAEILQTAARSGDIVARYGGEEFAIVLIGANAENAKVSAERFRIAIEKASWEQRSVTASFGIATFDTAPFDRWERDISALHPTPTDITTLIAEADAALYRSKLRGRNCTTHIADALQASEIRDEKLTPFRRLMQQMMDIQKSTLASASQIVKETLFRSYDSIVLAWSHTLSLQETESDDRNERVAERMVQLARAVNMNEDEVLYAKWGALLHDIGKSQLPDGILDKKGPLTAEEQIVMRQYPVIAYELLQSITFLGPALDIPRHHHEKWDGTGYPNKLKGDEIPLLARLFAVIYVYDALCSDRPYRPAWSEADAKEYLRTQAGTQFDPRAVDAFLTMLEAV